MSKRRFGPAEKREFVKLLAAGNYVVVAAAAVGFSRDCVYRHIRQDPDFAAAVERACAKAESEHVANIVTAGSKGNWQASAWWLERTRAHRYGRLDRVSIDTSQMTDEELAQVEAGADPREVAPHAVIH